MGLPNRPRHFKSVFLYTVSGARPLEMPSHGFSIFSISVRPPIFYPEPTYFLYVLTVTRLRSLRNGEGTRKEIEVVFT
jgi:hypothetical protein